MKKIFYLSIIFSILISSFLTLKGIDWGRPKNMDLLLFNSQEEKNILIKPMSEIYQDIWQEKKFYEDEYKAYNPEENIIIKGQKEIYTTKAIISCYRTYLLRSYGLDEEVPFNVLKNINLVDKQFNPKYFGYGNFYIYTFAAFMYTGKFLYNLKLEKDINFFLNNYNEMTKIYIWGRLFSLFSFIFCILIFAFLIKKFSGKITPFHILSIFSFSVFPPFILWTHFTSPFIFGLLFGILTLFSIFKIVKTPNNKNFYISAFACGFSSGILMSYSLIFPFIVYLLLYYHKHFSLLFLIIFFFLIGFLIANPFIILSFSIFTNELKWYFVSSEYSQLKISNILDYFAGTLKIAFGGEFTFLIFLTIIFAFLNSQKNKKIFYLFLFYLIFIFSLKFPIFIRHNFIVYFSILLFFLFACVEITQKYQKFRSFFISIFVLFTFYALFYSISISNNFIEENTHTLSSYFINTKIPEKSKIALLQYPSPWRTPAFHFIHYSITTNLEEGDYIILSQIEDNEGKIKKDIEKKYQLVAKFSKPIKFLNFPITQSQLKIRDWIRVNPEIYIFKKR